MRLLRGMLRHDRLLGMVSPMIVWALYFLAVYSLAGLRCGAPPAGVPHIGEPWLDLLLGTCTLLALLATGALGLRAWRAWRTERSSHARAPVDTHDRRRFMALVMLVLAALAAVASLLTALPLLMLETCQ